MPPVVALILGILGIAGQITVALIARNGDKQTQEKMTAGDRATYLLLHAGQILFADLAKYPDKPWQQLVQVVANDILAWAQKDPQLMGITPDEKSKVIEYLTNTAPILAARVKGQPV